MRCPRCGNANSEDNRFCGMCGAKLLPTPVGVASVPAQGAGTRSSVPTSSPSSQPVPPPRPLQDPRAPSAPPPQDSGFINGPSFLGLNDPSPKRGNLNSGAHSSSSNLEYLLDDEDEHRGGGAGKFVLILLALALAAGLGYLRWKNQGLPGLQPSNKPAAAAPNPDTTDSTSSTTSPSPGSTPAPAASQPAAQPATDASATPPASTPASSPATANAPAASNPSSGNTSPAPENAPQAANPPVTTGETPASSTPSNSDPEPSATNDSPKEGAKDSAPEAAATPPAPNPKPKRAPAEAAPKPHAGVAPSASGDPVSEARKYIYGRGASQDCERGMRLLKPAAAQANPKAMIEMGALYSAGLCTPHDLPTAYRWFAMALRKEPDNQAVQGDLQKLWGEMTQPERQLAIRLSQ